MLRTLTPSGMKQGQVAVCNCSKRESSRFVLFGTATAFDATLGLATFIARARRWFLVNETCPVGGGHVNWTVSVLSPPPIGSDCLLRCAQGCRAAGEATPAAEEAADSVRG